MAVFDTHMMQDMRAHDKMEQMINEKLPRLKLMTPGLSIKVNGMEGPITDGELSKCVDFGEKIATQLKTQ